MRVAGNAHETIRSDGDVFFSYVRRQIISVLRDITNGFSGHVVVDDLAPITHRWAQKIDGGMLLKVKNSYMNGAKSQRARVIAARNALTSAADDEFDIPDVSDVQVEVRLAAARNRLVGIGNDVWDAARTELIGGLQAGEGISKLQDRVMGATGIAAPRAEVIARTEISSAMNAGSLDTMKSIQVSGMTKEWLAVLDNRTRPEHADVNGETIPLNGTFSIGEEPGDAPNCRCTYGFDMPDENF